MVLLKSPVKNKRATVIFRQLKRISIKMVNLVSIREQNSNRGYSTGTKLVRSRGWPLGSKRRYFKGHKSRLFSLLIMRFISKDLTILNRLSFTIYLTRYAKRLNTMHQGRCFSMLTTILVRKLTKTFKRLYYSVFITSCQMR
jgi:hypothetical protein